jgi:acyl-CoA synthetase (AMP-forming)/AMP-acid ligase II
MTQLQADDHVQEGDTLLAVLPFFHIYGLVVILSLGLAAGATIVTMPRFEIESYLAALERHRITLAHVVPPIVLQLAKHPGVERHDLSRLRKVFSGAAPLGEELTRACERRLGCTIRQGYGMTEASPATHMSPREVERIKPGSVGVLLANTECRVVDPRIVDPASGQDLGAGEAGEIWVRGPQVMKGYLKQPVATAETLDAEGWLHTGDVGTFDADGHFYVVDRLKELIKYKGLPVAPAEIEALLLSHPSVADAAVIGVPDPEAGEVPKAFVVLREPVTEAEILAFVSARVAPHKRVRRIETVDRIPRSPSGKILRRMLADRERSGGAANP